MGRSQTGLSVLQMPANNNLSNMLPDRAALLGSLQVYTVNDALEMTVPEATCRTCLTVDVQQWLLQCLLQLARVANLPVCRAQVGPSALPDEGVMWSGSTELLCIRVLPQLGTTEAAGRHLRGSPPLPQRHCTLHTSRPEKCSDWLWNGWVTIGGLLVLQPCSCPAGLPEQVSHWLREV